MRSFSLWIAIVLLLASCSEKTLDTPLDMGYAYYPLAVGQERIYEADSLTFRPEGSGTEVDSTRFFIRERVVDTFRAGTGELQYRIERSVRYAADEPWRLQGYLAAHRDDRRAFRQEGNLPYIKLVFPAREGERWQGNRFFADDQLRQRVAGELIDVFKEWSSEWVSVDEPYSQQGTTYDSVATVSHANFESLVDIRRVEERYARGVGLVFREMLILDSQCQVCCGGDPAACQAVPWRDRAEAGFILRERLIDFP